MGEPWDLIGFILFLWVLMSSLAIFCFVKYLGSFVSEVSTLGYPV